MNVEIKKLPDSEVEITGEISAGDFESFYGKALKEFSGNIKIDGFRPGNVPEKILIEKVGERALLEKMAEMALQKYYPEVIEEKKIKAIGRPEIIITKIARNNPLGFKIKTAVMPDIELADYKSIAKEIMKKEEEIKVEEKEIEEVIEHLRKARASKDEKGELVLSEINDDFAKSLGNFKNLEALKDTLKNNIFEEKKIKTKEKKRAEALEKIAESSKIEIPRIIIESEKEKMTEETRANIIGTGLKWEDYLNHIKKTEEELKRDWESDAIKRVKFGLILNEITEKEKIEVPEEELNRETERLLEYYKNSMENIDKDRAKSYTYGVLRNEKVFNLLESC